MASNNSSPLNSANGMKRYLNIARVLVITLLVLIITGCLYFNYMSSPVSKDQTVINFTVEKGDTYNTIASKLKEADLVKSDTFFKVYIKLMNANGLQSGIFELSKSMTLKEIVNAFEEGSKHSENAIRITFKENINMWDMAELIANNTNNSAIDVYNKLKDSNYIDTLINTYTFLTDRKSVV